MKHSPFPSTNLLTTWLVGISTFFLCHSLIAGAAVHPKAHTTSPEVLHAYGKLLENHEVGDWHDTAYWGISSVEDGHGIFQLTQWLEKNQPHMPIYKPVSGEGVRVSGAFVHPEVENGPSTHSAIDYSRPDGTSFPIHAIADGRVIWVGYHPSPGNVVIIEHTPPTGMPFRAIYHHVRNGRDRDIALARRTKYFIAANKEWSWDRYSKEYQENGERAFRMLEGEGFDGGWLQRHFGSNDQKLMVQEGDEVYAGQHIGWAGCSGMHCGHNHLHFMIARQAVFVDADYNQDYRRPGQTRWALFDPYGLYAGQGDLYAYNDDDGRRKKNQHPSLFAPAPQDFVDMTDGNFQKAITYYHSFDYHPTSLVMEHRGMRERYSFLPFSGPKETIWSYSGSFRFRPDLQMPLTPDKEKNFEKMLLKQSQQGRRPCAIIPCPAPDGTTYFTALLKEIDGKEFRSEPKLNKESFDLLMHQMHKEGYLLSDYRPFVDEGELYFSAHWVMPPKWADYSAFYELTHQKIHDAEREMQRRGFNLVKLYKYNHPTQGTRFAGLWYCDDGALQGGELDDTRYFLDLKKEHFHDNHTAMTQKGYELTHVDGYAGHHALIYKRFVDPTSETSPPPLQKRVVSLGDLMIDHTYDRRVTTLPVRGEILAGSCLAPQKEEPSPQEKAPLGKLTASLSSSLPPSSSTTYRAESLLNSMQVTEGRLIGEYIKEPSGKWTDHMQTLWTEAEQGAVLRLPLAVASTGRYQLSITYTRSSDSGVVQVYHNGQRQGRPFNGFSEHSGERQTVSIGELDLQGGVNYIDLRIRGKDRRSTHFNVGLHSFELQPAERAGAG